MRVDTVSDTCFPKLFSGRIPRRAYAFGKLGEAPHPFNVLAWNLNLPMPPDATPEVVGADTFPLSRENLVVSAAGPLPTDAPFRVEFDAYTQGGFRVRYIQDFAKTKDGYGPEKAQCRAERLITYKLVPHTACFPPCELRAESREPAACVCPK
jgi:hypothetical protein